MRLLKLENDGQFSLVEYSGDEIPHYAILSHTWGAANEEVTFKDLTERTGKHKVGYRKLNFCGKQAERDGLRFFWVHTCCIDKSNSTEVGEAIVSMFRWYQNADVCYVYLSDVSVAGPVGSNFGSQERRQNEAFRLSRWHTRGWTLQELVAPRQVEFFSAEGTRLGDKQKMAQTIHDITGISVQVLQSGILSQVSVEERMSWTERRQTTRNEDAVYCLLGIFGVHMLPMYGEGRENAMRRLRKEIQDRHDDVSSAVQPAISPPQRKREPYQEKSYRKGRPKAICFKCGQRGHYADEPHCDDCDNEFGHTADDPHCYKCQKHGHYANALHCYKCNSTTHLLADCPYRTWPMSTSIYESFRGKGWKALVSLGCIDRRDDRKGGDREKPLYEARAWSVQLHNPRGDYKT